MRIIAFSDSHTQHSKIEHIPHGDVLVYAGDISGNGEPWEIKRFDKWLGYLPHKHKIVIAGNHDRNFERQPGLDWITNATYLQDEEIIIDGVKFYCSPWTPSFAGWSFMRDRGPMMERTWSFIPEDTDVLVTHGPPKGIMDECPNGFKAGCEELLKAVERIKPKFHIFGHIHSQHGKYKKDSIIYANVSVLNDNYEMRWNPTVIDI